MRQKTGMILSQLRAFLLSPFFWISALLCIAFWSLSLFFTPFQGIQLSNYFVVSLGIGGLFAYVPLMLYSIRTRSTRVALVAAGINLMCLSQVELRSWAIIYRITDWLWMANSWWNAFFIFHAAIGIVLLMTPPGVEEEDPIAQNWIRIGTIIAVGLTVGGLMIAFGLDKEIVGPPELRIVP